MTAYSEIRDDLAHLSGWSLVAFSLACAERVAPVFRRLAEVESARLFDRSLRDAWSALQERRAGSEVAGHLTCISQLPEANASDSDSADYYAMLALSVLNDSLDTMQTNGLQAARSASEGAMNLLGNFDVVMRGPSAPREISSADALLPGPLEQGEIREQRALLQVLEGRSEVTSELIAEVRHRARAAASDIASVLPEVVRRRGWAT